MPFRKISRCHEDIIGILYKVANNLNISEIDYVVEFGCEDIDIFLSGTYNVHIKGLKDGQKVKYNLILKWHGDPKRRHYFRELYRREYIFLQRIFPELLDIQKRYKVIEGLKIKVLNCIYASIVRNKETIVILLDDGFQCLNRFHTMDLAHASLVMKNLAKLHALSFVLEKTNPTVYKELKRQCSKDVQYSDPDCIPKSMQCYYNVSVNAVSDQHAKAQLKALGPNIVNVLRKCTEAGPYSTVCHADCWTNNILFKYKRRQPVDVLFIDYQLCRFASPVTDISYYLYMTTERDFLIQYYDRLLEIYYGTLSGLLRQCNMDVEEVYPKFVFRAHLKRYSVLGLIEALVSMKVITAATEEAFKMTEMMYNTEDGLCENVTQNQSLYTQRVNGIVQDFFERGYSLDDVVSINA